MRNREPLRKFFSDEDHRQVQINQADQQLGKLSELKITIAQAFGELIKYLDGKTTKTEIINQLKEIRTPDIEKVVKELQKVDKRIYDTKIDIKPLSEALKGLHEEIKLIPKELPDIPEAKDKVSVTNLKEINLNTKPVEKAIKGLKLDVKAPIINTEKTDLKPLQNIMLDLLKAVNKQKFEAPDKIKIKNLDEIKPPSLKNVEKKLDTSNKHLKTIAEKKVGSGGGGGESALEFSLYANIDGEVVISGDIITITKTDGDKTKTKTIDVSNKNDITLLTVWS